MNATVRRLGLVLSVALLMWLVALELGLLFSGFDPLGFGAVGRRVFGLALLVVVALFWLDDRSGYSQRAPRRRRRR